MPNPSLWNTTSAPAYAALDGDVTTEVVVVGAGLAGLHTAAMLVRNGHDVVVLEARSIGAGTSGHTTAKVSALQGLRYREITQGHGADAARRYARAQIAGFEWMRERITTGSVDCDWERRAAVTYATTPEGRTQVMEEVSAAAAAGLPVVAVDDAGLPFRTTGAVRLEAQAQFDPVRYLHALAAEVDAAPRGAVHEQTRVSAVHGRHGHRVVTEQGTVHADHVVIATLLPIVYRGLFFARAEPKSSYIVALHTDGDIPTDMYLSADSPTRSLRTSPAGDGEAPLLLVGGGGHTTGLGTPTAARYEELITWARAHFPVTEERARWSAHDYIPADHLPWVGPASPITPTVLVATGFEKWGMTMSAAAGLALTDRIEGNEDGPSEPWAGVFDPKRLAPRGVRSAARINGEVALHLTQGWLRPDEPPATDGAGAVRRSGLLPVGDGEGHAQVVVVCSHLGGVCRWNDAEHTWDCPLHGSRFTAEGDVLTGPATAPLHVRTPSGSGT